MITFVFFSSKILVFLCYIKNPDPKHRIQQKRNIMIRTRLQLSSIFFLLFFFYPVSAIADACQSIANTINDDISKYGDALANEQLPWMKLSWLQEQLGSADTKNATNDSTQYEWRCGNNISSLTVSADSAGNILNVNGQYNSENGSGLFEAKLPEHKSDQEFNQMIAQLDTKTPTPNIPSAENNATDKCNTLIHQIRSDLSNYSNTTQSKQWMNLLWLKRELGQAHTMATYDYVYEWADYSLFISADGSQAESGTPPKGMRAHTYADASALLGRPKKTLFEKLTVNTWQCPTTTHSTLSMITANKTIPLSISGNDCNEGKCNTFSMSLSDSALKQKFTQYIREQNQVNAAILAAKLSSYNANYKTMLHTNEELEIDSSLRIKNYYLNLSQCHPGIYHYALPVLNNFLYHTAVVNPQKDGACLVTTSYVIPQIGKMELKCHYQPQSLKFFTSAESINAITNHLQSEEQRPSELQRTISRECKRYIDGVL